MKKNSPENNPKEKPLSEETNDNSPKKKEELHEKRNRYEVPGHDTIEHQIAETDETFSKEEEEAINELEETMLKEGVEIKPEEFGEFADAIPELIGKSNPELSEYLKDMSPRLKKITEETSVLKERGYGGDALDKLVDFLDEEENRIGKLKDPNTKETLLRYLGYALNTPELAKDIKKHTPLELVSSATDMVPVVGGMKMAYEAANGKTASGHKLEGTGRLWHGGMAVVSLTADVAGIAAGLATAGAGTVAVEGAKVAVISGNAASKGSRIAQVIMKFAALCQKTEKFKGVAVTIAKVSKLCQSPGFIKVLTKFQEIKEKYPKVIKLWEARKAEKKAMSIAALDTKIAKRYEKAEKIYKTSNNLQKNSGTIKSSEIKGTKKA